MPSRTSVPTATKSKTIVGLALVGGVAFAAMLVYGGASLKKNGKLPASSTDKQVPSQTQVIEVPKEELQNWPPAPGVAAPVPPSQVPSSQPVSPAFYPPGATPPPGVAAPVPPSQVPSSQPVSPAFYAPTTTKK